MSVRVCASGKPTAAAKTAGASASRPAPLTALQPGAGPDVDRVPSTSQPATLTVRPALPGDLVPLTFFCDIALRKDYFLRRGQLQELMCDRRHNVYVAEVDGQLVGMAITTRGARLINVLVDPALRGIGIGRELVEKTRAAEVRAKIDSRWGDPRAFYEKLGFVRTGEFNAKGNIELMRRPSDVERPARDEPRAAPRLAARRSATANRVEPGN